MEYAFVTEVFLIWGLDMGFWFWEAYFHIWKQSLLISYVDVYLSRANEKREISSAKSLWFNDKTISKSPMQTKNNKIPRIKHWETQQLIQKIVPLELLFDSNTKEIKSRWLITITLFTVYAWKHGVDFSFGSESIPAGWNTFKNEEKGLLFHVKSTFRS